MDPALTDARDSLVLAHVGLVRSLASRLSQRLPADVERADLESVGVMGLIDAAGRYQPSTGVPFDAFARRRVHGAMLDSLRDLDWAPRSVRRTERAIRDAAHRLRRELGRDAGPADIAADLGVSEAEYDRLADRVRAAGVRPVARDLDAAAALDAAVDPHEGPHERLERLERRRRLARALAALPRRERRVLTLSYRHGLTLAEIGRAIGVGESRASQLRTKALARLRTLLEDQPAVQQESRWRRH